MDDRFEERLRDRLNALDERVPPEAPEIRPRLATRVRPRVVRTAGKPSLGLAAALGLALVALISAGLFAQRYGATASTGSPTAAATASTEAIASARATPTIEPPVSMGSEGYPVSIDGQQVYLLDDLGTWQSLSGSFLLAAVAPYGSPSCPPSIGEVTPGPTADADLMGRCATVILFNISGYASGSGGSGRGTADKGLSIGAISGWGGHIIVVRVHTHDPEAAQCSSAARGGCENALVVESIVWPAVPDQIAGAHVYRLNDEWSGNLAGLGRSFLFGGLVRVQATAQQFSECSASTAASRLLTYCSRNSTFIDGIASAPNGEVQVKANQVVVVRAHVNDPSAADCPAALQTACEQSLVVESVVWSSKPYSTAPSVPMATPSGTP